MDTNNWNLSTMIDRVTFAHHYILSFTFCNDIKGGLKSMPEGPPTVHLYMSWALTPERRALSQGRHQCCWVHQQQLQPTDWGLDLDLDSIESLLYSLCGPGGPPRKVENWPGGESSADNVHHTPPCTTF